MLDNYHQAEKVLLKLRDKLVSQPELRSKYCQKIEAAIAEGHIIRISDEELKEEVGTH